MSSSTPLMGASSLSDPFNAALQVLEGEVAAVRLKYDAWRIALNTKNTASDISFKVQHEEMQKELNRLAETCRKLTMAIQNIERNRVRFPHVDDYELTDRKTKLSAVDKAVQEMKSVFGSAETKAKLEADARRELAARTVHREESARKNENAYVRSNADYMRDQSQQQATITRQHDEIGVAMSSSIARITDMARTIGDEITEQDKMLTDIDTEVDVAQSKMDHAIKGIEKLLQTKSGCQLAIIAILVLVFVAVAIVAFYMLTK